MDDVFAAILAVAVPVFAVSSMLSVGLANPLERLLGPLGNLRAVFRALVANFVLVPLLALGVIQLMSLAEPHAIGLILVSVAAGAPFLIKLTEAAESDVALSATLLVLLLPATIVYMPVVVPYLVPGSEADPGGIAIPLVVQMLLPLAVGLVIRWSREATAGRLQPLMGRLSTVSLIALVLSTVILHLPSIRAILGRGAILAAFLVVAGAAAIGLLMGGRDRESQEVLALGTGQRNIAAATVVATGSFEEPEILVMVVVTSLVAFAVLFPLAVLLRKRERGVGSEAPSAVPE